MNGILGMAQLLERSELDAAQRQYLQTIGGSGQALCAVLDDILDMTKAEAGKLQLRRAEIDVRGLTETVVRMLRARAWEKHLEFAVLIAPEVPRLIEGDPARLRQVLLNLVGNAIKFTDTGGVTLRVERGHIEGAGDRALLRFSVSDTGIGIPDEAHAKLFKPFSQVDQSYTRRHNGTGLALALAHRLVALMGGEIGFTSVVGEGSTFWFTIPAAVIAATPAEEPHEPTPQDVLIALAPRGREAQAEEQAADDLDLAVFRDLEETLGRDKLVEILGMFLDMTADMGTQLESAIGEADAKSIHRTAHDVAGAAGNLGFAVLSQAGRSLAQAARGGEFGPAVKEEAEALHGTMGRARLALLKLYPELRGAA